MGRVAVEPAPAAPPASRVVTGDPPVPAGVGGPPLFLGVGGVGAPPAGGVVRGPPRVPAGLGAPPVSVGLGVLVPPAPAVVLASPPVPAPPLELFSGDTTVGAVSELLEHAPRKRSAMAQRK